MNTHAAPALPLSAGPPTSALFPPTDSATPWPNLAAPVAPSPVSFGPCWTQLPPEKAKTHAAPTLPSSSGAPTSAVVPSADSATL